MSRMFEEGLMGGTFGGMLGGALGTIFTGAVLALPGVNIVMAPIVAAAVATTITASRVADGTTTTPLAEATTITVTESVAETTNGSTVETTTITISEAADGTATRTPSEAIKAAKEYLKNRR